MGVSKQVQELGVARQVASKQEGGQVGKQAGRRAGGQASRKAGKQAATNQAGRAACKGLVGNRGHDRCTSLPADTPPAWRSAPPARLPLRLQTLQASCPCAPAHSAAPQCLSEADRSMPAVASMLPLLKRGIGVHHSGAVPALSPCCACCCPLGAARCLVFPPPSPCCLCPEPLVTMGGNSSSLSLCAYMVH